MEASTCGADRYPEAGAVRFVSDQEVEMRQSPGCQLELHSSGQRVRGPLPGPAPENFSTLKTADGVVRDGLYQVVR